MHLDIDDITFRRVLVGDTPYWQYSDGTLLPVVRGGEGDDDPDPEPDPDTDPAAEVAKWKKLARKHEDRAKANAKAARELEELKRKSLPDNERELREAEERGRTAASAEYAQQLAAARIEAALTGVVDDPADIVEDLNLAKFVTDDGEVDSDAIDELKARYAARMGQRTTEDDDEGGKPTPKPKPDLKQGKRGKPGSGAKPQLTREDLQRMSSEEIVAAKKAGQFDQLLGKQT